MKTILIIGILFTIYKLTALLISRKKEQAREEAEYQRQTDAATLRQEWREMQEKAKQDVLTRQAEFREQERQRKLAELDREALWKEQDRLWKEQERQAKEQTRLAKEQDRQAAQLAKHEDLIMKLNYRLEKAEDEIFHFTSVLEGLENDKDTILAELTSINEKLNAQNRKQELDAKFMTLGYDSAEMYAEIAGDALNKDKELDKMTKRKTVLEGKLRVLNNSIFNTEQKIKKAEFDKYEAERKLA